MDIEYHIADPEFTAIIEVAHNGFIVISFKETDSGIRIDREVFEDSGGDMIEIEPDESSVRMLWSLVGALGINEGSKHTKKRLRINLEENK